MTLTAVGTSIAGMLIGEEGILAFAFAMADLGLGLILARVWFNRDVERPPKTAL